jgi:chemosensory pili system protein ChpA (sensor histidine kinase/response regulator)
MTLAVAPATGAVKSAPRTVLVVDRGETIRRVLALILESEGFHVVTTDTPSAAVAVAFEIAPAAVLLDLSFAEQSGVAALRELKADGRTRDVPVVLLTTCGTSLSELEHGLAAAVLTKPLDLDDLANLVSGLVPAFTA